MLDSLDVSQVEFPAPPLFIALHSTSIYFVYSYATPTARQRIFNMSFNLQGMMGKIQELQSKVAEVQKDLESKRTTGESGGGMVVVTINGKQEVVSIKLEKSIVVPDEIEMLEDLIVSAVNKAIENSQKLAQEEMSKATSGMLPNIPGLNLGT